MNGRFTNHELGRALHNEYEAEACCQWGREVTNEEKPGPENLFSLALTSTDIAITLALASH